MSGAKTRKQKVVEAVSAANGDILPNGHAKGNGTIGGARKSLYKQENIFVFIPNLIGGLYAFASSVLESSLTLNLRLFARHTRHRLSLLYAPSSTNLFPTLQHIMSARCA